MWARAEKNNMSQIWEVVSEEEEFDSAWGETCSRFGDLVSGSNLKTLANQGLKQFGQGVLCLGFRNGEASCGYLPKDKLWLLLKEQNEEWSLLSRLSSYEPEKSELIVLVTFGDIEIEKTSCYQYFYLSLEE